MLFPELKNASWMPINLNLEAEKWLSAQPSNTPNPLLDPATCQKFVAECHQRLGIDYSYGGWMEDRSTLWQGSYLDNDARYIHLGVDFNVPAGTPVAIERSCTVLRIDNDYPDKYGWGTRIIMREPGADVVLLFAHLDEQLSIRVGDQLSPNTTIARVGKPPYNGDWFPHLHVQTVQIDHYTELLKTDLRKLDGYGHTRDIEVLKRDFPNPLKYIPLQ